jgi:hypothetical protein
MFGKDKKEKKIEEKPSWQVEEEKREKRKQEFISEKMELTEKELLIEILWSLTGGAKASIIDKLYDIQSNTDDAHNQKMRQYDRFP